MARKDKPSTIPISPSFPQPAVDSSGLTVTATLPSRDSVTVNLLGATVTSWTTIDPASSSRTEKLFLSTAAKLDGSKAIRGGIPIVFPVFGPPPKDHATSKLPQHGFARNLVWQFLGKNSSESESADGNKGGGDEEVKLDFGLSAGMLSAEMREKWPYDFGLVYSVTLGSGYLDTGLQVRNESEGQTFEFQALFHNYFRVEDISKTSVLGLDGKPFLNKITSERQQSNDQSNTTKNKDDAAVTLSSATDTVYSNLTPSDPITIRQQANSPTDPNPQGLEITRESLPDCTIWNPWQQGAESMSDFEPKTGYQNLICVEPGAVDGWVRLEAGDVWEGRQSMRAGSGPGSSGKGL